MSSQTTSIDPNDRKVMAMIINAHVVFVLLRDINNVFLNIRIITRTSSYIMLWAIEYVDIHPQFRQFHLSSGKTRKVSARIADKLVLP